MISSFNIYPVRNYDYCNGFSVINTVSHTTTMTMVWWRETGRPAAGCGRSEPIQQMVPRRWASSATRTTTTTTFSTNGWWLFELVGLFGYYFRSGAIEVFRLIYNNKRHTRSPNSSPSNVIPSSSSLSFVDVGTSLRFHIPKGATTTVRRRKEPGQNVIAENGDAWEHTCCVAACKWMLWA